MVQHINTNRFEFDRAAREFHAEISALSHGGMNIFGLLREGCADQGFVLVSHRTGNMMEVYLDYVQRDNDQDVIYWCFKPTERAKYLDPHIADVKVIVDND